MVSTGFAKTNIKGKCDECRHYRPLFKPLYGFNQVMLCHGHCTHIKSNRAYKQRTDTCKKFEVNFYEL